MDKNSCLEIGLVADDSRSFRECAFSLGINTHRVSCTADTDKAKLQSLI